MGIYKIYCDESRQLSSEYKLIGGIWIRTESGWDFVQKFHAMCMTNVGMLPAHMKWSNVPTKSSSKYFCFYKELIDLFFEYNERGIMNFRTIVAGPDYIMNHSVHHSGDYEEGFYKLYYYLIQNTLSVDHYYHLRVAQRPVGKKQHNVDEKQRLSDLKNSLNNEMRRKYANAGIYFSRDHVLSIQARPAKERVLIQLADILTGAVGYHWHGEHTKPDASEGKLSLSRYISDKLGRPDLNFVTPPSDKTFNIFRIRPGK